ncbi:4350_t:CDS:1 [Ambispora gerdemannii]|uniref:4350_t:CDS:1 n=1 Tax=Ambispora gerdemannii TaxID=144530 RepID=A0A9N9CYM6_9GLOM|nr:4350_t:CDS:1 [Ambispora gerdemannii]
MEERSIQRKALGRTAEIGALYNSARDSFCGTTLLQTETHTNKVDSPHSELSYSYEDSYNEKFSKLNIEAELKLSFLAGLVSSEASGKYLSNIKKSSKTVKGTLIYKVTLVSETWDIYREDVKASISIDALNNPDATHVVIGIKWGANIMASFEYNDTNEENKSQIEGSLKANLPNLIKPSGGGHLHIRKSDADFMNKFSINIVGDIVPNEKALPQSFEEAKKIVASLPQCTKEYNNGKGVPVEYTLLPLSELAKILNHRIAINNIITNLNEETIIRVEQLFDSLIKSKQSLNDLHESAKSISDFLPEIILNEINTYLTKVSTEEAKFRRELAESLVKVRSGKEGIDKLESKLKQFENGALSKQSIIEFIDNHRLIYTKIEFISALKANEIRYLGKKSTINNILFKYQDDQIFILFFDDDDNFIDGKTSPIYNMFRDLSTIEKQSKFIMANLKLFKDIERPVIHHYNNGRVCSDDYYNDKKDLFNSNLVKFEPAPILRSYNSGETLSLPCPGLNCSKNTCIWKCYNCEQNVEYNFNRHFYCKCGESNITDCKFKCNSPRHTEGFMEYDERLIHDLLPKPPKEINILLLGETGVGKSTFINAFANYLKYDSLEDAKKSETVALISSKFNITDKNYETKEIKIGEEDENEKFDVVGASATQECKSYVFHQSGNHRNITIRLIDTPGIGDTRGLDQDKKNFENILRYISYHNHLNGICVLLKPNESRTSVLFRFCIQELLSHLHKSAKDNIVFCFTNARGTLYRPGDTLPSLKKHLRDIQEQFGVEIEAVRDTMYCFDSESFKFLAALKQNVAFTEDEEKSFSESWKTSVKESERLVEYLVTRPHHSIKDTLTLNNSREIVLLLSKPLAEIGQLIEINIKMIEDKQTEIENSNKTMEQLEGKLYIPQVDLEPIALSHPSTICNECKTHCHPHCFLPFATQNSIGSKFLLLCSAINYFSGTCKICECHRSKHAYVNYENKQVIKDVLDPKIEQISKNQNEQERKITILKIYEARSKQLEKEKETIEEINLKFAQFLRQNAITPFNDAYADYLDLFIREEGRKRGEDPKNYNNKILERLKKTKETYLRKIEIIKQAIEKKDNSLAKILPKDISKFEQQLYNLEINGSTLKKIKKVTEQSHDKEFKYREIHYDLKNKNKRG